MDVRPLAAGMTPAAVEVLPFTFRQYDHSLHQDGGGEVTGGWHDPCIGRGEVTSGRGEVTGGPYDTCIGGGEVTGGGGKVTAGGGEVTAGWYSQNMTVF